MTLQIQIDYFQIMGTYDTKQTFQMKYIFTTWLIRNWGIGTCFCQYLRHLYTKIISMQVSIHIFRLKCLWAEGTKGRCIWKIYGENHFYMCLYKKKSLQIFISRAVRIQIRIDPPHPFLCRKRRQNGPVLRIRPEKKPKPCVTAGVKR
jgi:hypothetical protein